MLEEGTEAADLTGSTLGEFRLERRLGEGGMGQVYLAEQLSLRRRAAVKVMRAELTSSPSAKQRFQTEARAVASLSHPHIVQIFAVGEQDGMQYLALEFVEGTNLGSHLDARGAMPLPWAVSLLIQVASALNHAGEHGIVHRDIKPENILLTKDQEAKVTDFGLARSTEEGSVHVTKTGVVVGTPVYMSPEQVQGKPPDCRTDLYSLGVTAYHMLAGRPPFRGETAFDLALQHVQSPPPSLRELRPEVPAELESIVLRLMAKDPDDRFASGGELARALEALGIAGGTGVSTEMVSVATVRTRPSGSPHSWRYSWVLVAGVFVALIGLGVAIIPLLRKPPPARDALVTQPVEEPKKVKPPPPPAESLEQQEARLRRAVPDTFSDPENKPRKFQQEMHACVELGSFHLKHKQLDKAKTFFQNLYVDQAGKPKKPPHVGALGTVGVGIVQSFQGNASQSNDTIEIVNRQRSGSPDKYSPRRVLFRDDLKPWVKEALDRNAKAGPLPVSLRKLRTELDKPPPAG